VEAPPPPPDVIVEQPAQPAPAKPASAKSLATLTGEAEAGNVPSMRDIGLKYLSGDGVGVNEPEAARWLMRAAYKGEPVAEYWLATLYARGRGVPADAFQANHWYEAAAKQGSRRAMHSLAVANFEGWGMEKENLEEAARWFGAAAELGLADSQFNLAVLYERGSGVPQSAADAYKWYALAAAQGDKEAENRLKILAGQMKPADLAAAQGAVAAFKPKAMDEAANTATDPSYLPPQPPG
jgi:localization factor PodJL